MKNKGIVFVMSFLLFMSCKVQSPTLAPFLYVYKRDWSGEVLPVYIILRTQPKVYEMNAPSMYESVFGQWQINKDTLYLYPEYDYYSLNYLTKMDVIKDSSVITIPLKYVIKRDLLIDATDYGKYFPDIVFDTPDVFKRIR
ncbi:MAG: hypothetical protein IK022_07660 [Bacteroidales bacterium]|nr:hypothetical protein [Bacteroidales bacterium]